MSTIPFAFLEIFTEVVCTFQCIFFHKLDPTGSLCHAALSDAHAREEEVQRQREQQIQRELQHVREHQQVPVLYGRDLVSSDATNDR